MPGWNCLRCHASAGGISTVREQTPVARWWWPSGGLAEAMTGTRLPGAGPGLPRPRRTAGHDRSSVRAAAR